MTDLLGVCPMPVRLVLQTTTGAEEKYFTCLSYNDKMCLLWEVRCAAALAAGRRLLAGSGWLALGSLACAVWMDARCALRSKWYT